MTNQKRGLYQGDMKKVAKWLKEIRYWRGCTDKALAESLGSSSATISFIFKAVESNWPYRCRVALVDRIIEQYEEDLAKIRNLFSAVQVVEQENQTAAGFAKDYTLQDLVTVYESQERLLNSQQKLLMQVHKEFLDYKNRPSLWQRFTARWNKPVEVKS